MILIESMYMKIVRMYALKQSLHSLFLRKLLLVVGRKRVYSGFRRLVPVSPLLMSSPLGTCFSACTGWDAIQWAVRGVHPSPALHPLVQAVHIRLPIATNAPLHVASRQRTFLQWNSPTKPSGMDNNNIHTLCTFHDAYNTYAPTFHFPRPATSALADDKLLQKYVRTLGYEHFCIIPLELVQKASWYRLSNEREQFWCNVVGQSRKLLNNVTPHPPTNILGQARIYHSHDWIFQARRLCTALHSNNIDAFLAPLDLNQLINIKGTITGSSTLLWATLFVQGMTYG